MDPLAEMHLLLREHGWEPEVDDESERMYADKGLKSWIWWHPDRLDRRKPNYFSFRTHKEKDGPAAWWMARHIPVGCSMRDVHADDPQAFMESTSVEDLAKRLKELATSRKG